jgi:Family of unknown function (DUF1028)
VTRNLIPSPSGAAAQTETFSARYGWSAEDMEPLVSTYSIAACDLVAGQWGVAAQPKFLAVGSLVPSAEPQVGAIATQALVNPQYGSDGLELLRRGSSANDVLRQLTQDDPGRVDDE